VAFGGLIGRSVRIDVAPLKPRQRHDDLIRLVSIAAQPSRMKQNRQGAVYALHLCSSSISVPATLSQQSFGSYTSSHFDCQVLRSHDLSIDLVFSYMRIIEGGEYLGLTLEISTPMLLIMILGWHILFLL
jgi:hypothetical protein